jgi:hypothetical protein
MRWMMIETRPEMRVHIRLMGNAATYTAKVVEVADGGHVMDERIVAFDELGFDTLPMGESDDAVRLASVVEVVCMAVKGEVPAKMVFDVVNLNHAEYESGALQ